MCTQHDRLPGFGHIEREIAFVLTVFKSKLRTRHIIHNNIVQGIAAGEKAVCQHHVFRVILELGHVVENGMQRLLPLSFTCFHVNGTIDFLRTVAMRKGSRQTIPGTVEAIEGQAVISFRQSINRLVYVSIFLFVKLIIQPTCGIGNAIGHHPTLNGSHIFRAFCIPFREVRGLDHGCHICRSLQ